jgi:hypothetical protein
MGTLAGQIPGRAQVFSIKFIIALNGTHHVARIGPYIRPTSQTMGTDTF